MSFNWGHDHVIWFDHVTLVIERHILLQFNKLCHLVVRISSFVTRHNMRLLQEHYQSTRWCCCRPTHTLLHCISTFCWAFHCWFREYFKGLTFFVKRCFVVLFSCYFVIFMPLWINMRLSNTDTLSPQTGNSLFPLVVSQPAPNPLGVPWNNQSPFIFNFLFPLATLAKTTFRYIESLAYKI